MLVGRSRELDTLRAAAERALAGVGEVVALVGVPGIGKTRLADEISRRAPELGLEAHWGRAWETGGAPAYFPWAQVLRSIRARAPEREVPEALRAILDLDRPLPFGEAQRSDPDAARFTLFQAVLAYLLGAAERAPQLIVFDDVHMADVPSLELLHFVARAVRHGRLLLVPTWRDAEARLPAIADPMARIQSEANVLRLGRLGRTEIATLLLDFAGNLATDPELPGLLAERTDGNPLFVQEALRLIADGGRLADLPIAAGVDAVIRQRLRLARTRAQELLPAAAILGREIRLDLLAETAEMPRAELERLCLELSSVGILERWDGGFRFAHVLFADALREQQAPETRRRLHARAAGALVLRIEGGDDSCLDLCAHHALEALPELPEEQVVALVLRAQERARAGGAYEAAVALLERMRAALPRGAGTPALEAEVALALGWAALDAGRPDTARDAFAQAVAIARRTRDPLLLARAALGRGGQFVLGDVRQELVELLEEALALLPPDAKLLRARLRARLAAALVPGVESASSLELAREAIAAVAGHADDRAVLDVMVSAGSALIDFAPPEERWEVNQELVRRARRLGDRVLELRGVSRLVTDSLEAGDTAGAEALLRARDELALELKLPRYQWQAPLFHSMRIMIEGRFDECEAAVGEALARAERAQDENARRCIAVHRNWLYLLANRVEALARHEPEALNRVASMPGAFPTVVSIAVRAAEGNYSAVRELLGGLTPELLRAHGTLAMVTLADAALDANDPRHLGTLYEGLLPAARRNAIWGPFGLVCLPPIAATLGRLEARLGHTAAAAPWFEAALERTRSMRAPAHEVWVRTWWAESLPERAGEIVPEAEALAESLGMPALAGRLRALRGRGAAAPEPAPVSFAPQALAFSLEKSERGWQIERAGRTFELRPLRGLEMIARLVECHGREIHATELFAGSADASAAMPSGDAGELLDETARGRYRQRLVDLREDLEQAQAAGQSERAESIHEEMAALARELARAVGKGGRLRRAGSSAERARVSVQHRVREAIRKIAELDPELGRHLDWAVRTGAFCVYDPDRRPG